MIPGRGVAAKVKGYHVLAGNRAMLNENNITFPQQMTTQAEEFINRGCTMIYISLDSLFIGYVVLSDTIRSESVGTIKVLEALNVQPVLLTGDNEKAAASIARQLGISEIQANCLPEDKLKYINEYQNRQEAVCTDCRQSPRLFAEDFSVLKRLKVSIFKTFQSLFGIIKVSKKAVLFYDDTRNRKSKKANADGMY